MTSRELLERIATALEAQKPERRYMDIEEAAGYLGIGVTLLRDLITNYGVRVYRAGKRIIFKREDLDDMMDNLAVTDMKSHMRVIRRSA